MKIIKNKINLLLLFSIIIFIFSNIYFFNSKKAYSQSSGLSIGGLGTLITPCPSPGTGCPPANCTPNSYQSVTVTPYGGDLPIAMPYICVPNGGMIPGLVGVPLSPGVTFLGLFQALTPAAIPLGTSGSY